ncbi:hypothetical protein Taro_018794 [Colocasia esculenta]|uniref:Retrotransposon gag domain-containing protein n=1 Tax=Colocasia esculenta TaxID=4460 RepID=A0A843V3I4_COLES|nr:hypothetical protein [Colocasia esculenta]
MGNVVQLKMKVKGGMCVLRGPSIILRVVQEKKANEFAGLRQLRMSVSEYEAQFARLSKYAPHLIATEKLKAKRFMNGLRPTFIMQLTPHLIYTYSEMVKRALALEAASETVDKIRDKSEEGSSDRKRKFESGNPPKVQQFGRETGKAPSGSKDVCKHYHISGPKAENCWRRLGACLKCGSTQHRIPDCPMIKSAPVKPNPQARQPKQGRIQAIQKVEPESPQEGRLIEGTLIVNSKPTCTV